MTIRCSDCGATLEALKVDREFFVPRHRYKAAVNYYLCNRTWMRVNEQEVVKYVETEVILNERLA